MAYLFAPGTTDVINCGTGVTKATTFSVFIRFKATAANAVDRRLLYLERRSDGHRQFGISFADIGTNVVSFESPVASNVQWPSGFTAGSIHTLVVVRTATNLVIYADTDDEPKVNLALGGTPDTDADLGQSFYLLAHKFSDDSIWRVPITLNTTALGVTVSVEPGQTAFRGVGRGLFRGIG